MSEQERAEERWFRGIDEPGPEDRERRQGERRSGRRFAEEADPYLQSAGYLGADRRTTDRRGGGEMTLNCQHVWKPIYGRNVTTNGVEHVCVKCGATQ